MEKHKIILKLHYNIDVVSIIPVKGGWSALAYKVECLQGVYFLKLYEKSKSGAVLQLKTLNLCMSVVSWLENNTSLCGKINAPLLTQTGDFKIESDEYAYLLFSYIDGYSIDEVPLSVVQQKELAEIVGELHKCSGIPFDLSEVKENFEVPCSELLNINVKKGDPLCVYREYDMIMKAVNIAKELSAKAKAANLQFVLCHADIHGWNLMQSKRLILIDWESIKFAPAEADLYTFWGDWYWGDSKWGSYWDTFLPVYHKINRDYVYNEETLRFYQIRRHIEDINDFYRQYLYDSMTETEGREVVDCLERECRFLNSLLK